jgi:hypothetical protein
MYEVRLGSGPGGTFTLDDPTRGEDGELWSVVATLDVDGLHASKQVSVHYATCMDELIAYLDDLAHNWRGWASEKTYRSLEGDLILNARHDGRHVILQVGLKRDLRDGGWAASGQVVTDPGAQMEEAAAAAHVVLARRPAP